MHYHSLTVFLFLFLLLLQLNVLLGLFLLHICAQPARYQLDRRSLRLQIRDPKYFRFPVQTEFLEPDIMPLLYAATSWISIESDICSMFALWHVGVLCLSLLKVLPVCI
jgi:hypothetical protein